MIHQRISVLPSSEAVLETYILSPSDQIQMGRKRPVVIVCPGGAYLRTSDQEAEQVALRFNSLGYHAAVLRYSCGEGARMPTPLLELGRAIKLLREKSDEWSIDQDHVALCGFSAGGHLCAMLGTQYARVASLLSCESWDVYPNAVILGYPCTSLHLPTLSVDIANFVVGPVDPDNPHNAVPPLFASALVKENGRWMLNFSSSMERHLLDPSRPTEEQKDLYSPLLHVEADTAPHFVWSTANDDLVPAIHSLAYVDKLWEKGVACEFHLFEDGHHGLSLADDTTADNDSMINRDVATWFALAANWLRKRFS